MFTVLQLVLTHRTDFLRGIPAPVLLAANSGRGADGGRGAQEI